MYTYSCFTHYFLLATFLAYFIFSLTSRSQIQKILVELTNFFAAPNGGGKDQTITKVFGCPASDTQYACTHSWACPIFVSMP